MNIAQDLKKFHLHDGSLLKLEHDNEENKLIWEIELCDWYAELAQPDEVFNKRGLFIFCEVSDFTINMPVTEIDFDFAEILDFEYNPDLDTLTKQGVEALLELGHSFPRPILQFRFNAAHFEWQEIGDVERY